MPDGYALDTKLLMRLLRENANFDEFLARGGDAVNNPTLPVCLIRYLSEADMSVAQVAEASMLSQSFAYQVFSGIRKPGRNALISVALALGLDVESTQRLLVVAQKGELYPRVRRDAAILFAIEHGYSLLQTEELLQSAGEASLLSRTYRGSF